MNAHVQALPFPAGALAASGEAKAAKPRRQWSPPSLSGLPRAEIAIPGAIASVLLLWALAPGLFASFSPTDLSGESILQAPGGAHLLGTDHLGRDVFSLIVHGTRQSLLIACSSVLISLVAGGAIGLVCGYAGRLVDMAVMRVIEVWMSIPDILLIIIIATALGPSVQNMILTIGMVLSPRYTRVMRAQVIALRHRPFVEAARAIGASDLSILLRHILPHTLSPMLVLASLGVATAALLQASLSFIGLSVVSDIPDWGYLLSQARGYLTVAWWFGAFPGLAITAFVISVNMLGEALRLRLDPRARAR
jgi:peptide/nickel transport system permease protein